eukprot:TRINITY_DN40004_c0_g1_i1.p1 TRINITY_DN40004_c0_g1~~TRINITY_DN40004_c0_g1_i1.p1  ORF type:complete len:323 (-),score=63.59 TRINITY_DN40004_c0_g1_i1:179-1147(-)
MAAGGYGGVELRQAAPVRDPFAWREALSPSVSPACSARNSRAGSRTPPGTPPWPSRRTPPGTPPLSPGGGYWAQDGSPHHAGAASQHSSMSSRSNRSAASLRNDLAYATPAASARSSDFMSVYDPNSARTTDFGTVYEDMTLGGAQPYHSQAYYANVQVAPPGGFGGASSSSSRPGTSGGTRRSRAAATAALDAFAPTEQQHEAADVAAPAMALDVRTVFSAARHSRHKDVEAALVAGFNPIEVDTFGNTLFHVACQNGNKRIAKLAIKYGGDMDMQNYKGQTGLHFLFGYGYPDIGEYFIEKGARDDILNESGMTAREGIR